MREKKTDAELPILLPFRPGIVSNGEYLPPEPNRRHRRAAQIASIGAHVAVLALVSVLAATACGDSDTPDPFSLEDLRPGSTLHTLDERYRRHGPAEPILSQHESYQPETLRDELWMEFDDDGALVSITSESRTPDGAVFSTASLENGAIVYEQEGVEVRRVPQSDGTVDDVAARLGAAMEEMLSAAEKTPGNRIETLRGVDVVVVEARRPFTSEARDVSPTAYIVPYLYDLRPIVEEVRREYIWVEGNRSLRSEVVMVSGNGTATVVESTEHLVLEVLP